MSMWMSVASVSICGAMSIGVAVVGDAANDAAKASSAADAAALAGAAAGPDAAARAAQLNGSLLVSFTTVGTITRVEVTVDNARAEASAERLLVPVTLD